MTITITAFEVSPDRGQGLARDMRVRWALEEVGQPYEVRLVPWAKFKEEAHLERNPFGQIPTCEDGGLVLFESGAIVLHIAERFPALLPRDANARSRAIQWMFAALNTVEPPILELQNAVLLEADKPWATERLLIVKDRVRARLSQLSAHLNTSLPGEGGGTEGGGEKQREAAVRAVGLSVASPHPLTPSHSGGGGDLQERDWLDGAFSAGDLMMAHTLQRLKPSGLLDEFPGLASYVARAEARPAYQRAFAAQKAVWEQAQ